MTLRDCTPARWIAATFLAAVCAACAACTAQRATPAPPADLLVSAGDSTYWVTSDSAGVRLRGVPMVLAQVEGRFRELYVADDDRSYPDALFVGQRLFARDLVRGDSLELMTDTVVPRLATAYAKSHPRVAPLAPDEDASDDPAASATANIELLGVHGPYVSFEYHTDLETHVGERRTSFHRVRRGLLDSRTGATVRLAALVGAPAAMRAENEGARAWAEARDSLTAQAPGEARARIAAITFDPRSFSLDAVARAPEVTFAIPSETRGGSASSAPTLPPQALPEGAWWTALKSQLPAGPDSLRNWTRGTLSVVASRENEGARLVLRDDTGREWKVGVIAAPVQRVVWLDASVDADTRKALRKAFSDASLYSESTRVAALAPSRVPATLAALDGHPGAPGRPHRRARRAARRGATS